MTALTEQDVAAHQRLGIPPDLLDRARVRRVTSEEARERLHVNHHGDLAGILYPRIDPDSGRDLGYRVRRDHPEIEDGRPKNKYLSSIDRAHLFFPPDVCPLLADPAVPCVIVESEKSVLALTAAAARAGRRLLVIGTGGCWGWKGRIGKAVDATGARVDEHGPLPDWDRVALADRDVVILFDANATTNESVRAARRGLRGELLRRRARVRLVDLPSEPRINGPDDFVAERGDAALWALLAATADTSARSALRVWSAREVIDLPRPIDVVEGLVSEGGVAVLVSESGTGKTFVLLDVAAHVADGAEWLGRKVQQGSVVYLSFEGDALGVRLRALHDEDGHRLDHLHVVFARDPLSPQVTREGETRSLGELAVTAALDALDSGLAAEQRPPIRLLIVDTVRASLVGSEDNSEHVAAYLRVVRRIHRRVPEAAVILAHHAGWQDGEAARKRERGSSAWRGNCDATFYLEAGEFDADRGETSLTLRTLKVRDAERPAPLHMVRRRVELAEALDLDDLRRGAVTSCIIERDRRTIEDREAERIAAVSDEQKAIDLTVLRALRDYPTATSIRRLRAYLGLRLDAVNDAVARLLRDGRVLEGKRGQPYLVTEAGQTAIDEAAS